MEEIKEVKEQVSIQYKAGDGTIYTNKDEAILHDKYLLLLQKVNQLKQPKSIQRVFYCETQEDFNLVVDMYAYAFPRFNTTLFSYVPDYHYSYSDFRGADWYFFQHKPEIDYDDEYWIETLTEKKAEWDEFYQQFFDDPEIERE